MEAKGFQRLLQAHKTQGEARGRWRELLSHSGQIPGLQSSEVSKHSQEVSKREIPPTPTWADPMLSH